MTQIIEIAPAKVNLGLKITGRREDGYHLLDSCFAFTEAGDRLFFEPASDLSLSLTGPFAEILAAAGAMADNLIMRSARALAKHAGVAVGAKITLEKNLPIAAGIGGGSADAAAAIRGLMRLWQLSYSQSELLDLAIGLGADVPACLSSEPKRVIGVGDSFTGLEPSSPISIILINPLNPLSTPAVFGAYKHLGGAFSQKTESLPTLGDVQNDLEPAAFKELPILEEALSYLKGCKGCALAGMSGSGATLYALFSSEDHAQFAKSRIKSHYGDWWVHLDRITPPRAMVAGLTPSS